MHISAAVNDSHNAHFSWFYHINLSYDNAHFSCHVNGCHTFQLLLARDLETVLALSRVCSSSSDRTALATSLLQIFRHERQEAHLLRTLNDIDIDSEGGGSYEFDLTQPAPGNL